MFMIVAMHGLEMKLNYGKENNETFSVLNLRNSFPFSCVQNNNINGDVQSIKCVIDGIPQSGFNPTKSSMMEFSYHMEDLHDDKTKKRMVLNITPIGRAKLQLFSVFSDLKTQKPITEGRRELSKSYQIVGYYTKIPFLKPEENLPKRDSINFPISIPGTATPMVSELDINRKPLEYIAGKDLEEFLEIRKLMQDAKYQEALQRIGKALEVYPNSLFTKDMIYYAIKALSHFKDEASQKYLMDAGTKWVKAYASDDNIPEVMYLLARAALGQNRPKEALYYIDRITDEYADSRYFSLAKMLLANTLKSQADLKRAPLIYREAYRAAKDLDSASQVAVSWARFNLRNNDLEGANEFFTKVFKVFPAYFLEDKEQTLEIIDELEEKEQYKMAADIADYLSGYMKIGDERHIALLDRASKLYTQLGEFDKAHKINMDFLNYYPDNKLAQEVRGRDNDTLFEISGDYKTKLAHFDSIIANYPNTDIATKAIGLKAKLFLDNKKYDEIIAMQDFLPKDSDILQKAIDNKLIEYLNDKNCVGIAGILARANKVSLNVAQSLDVFECLYNQASYKKANDLFSNLYKYIKDGDNQLKWLYLQANNLFALGEDKAGIKAGKDVMDLAFATGKTNYYDISFKMFSAYYNDENTRSQALSLGAKMEEWFKDDKRMLEVYYALLNEAQQERDTLAIKTQSGNLLRLQDKLQDYRYSPYVNFIYINLLSDEGKYNEALKELNKVAKFDLSIEDRQQRFYKIANINYTLKNMESSKKALQSCVALGKTNAWGTLCANALSLHDDGFE